MKNGKAITDPTSGYDPNNPYVNRDPRFRYSIIYNGAKFALNGSTQADVFTYVGAPTDGFIDPFPSYTTGYYSRKMCDSSSTSTNPNRAWPLIRYAEILLNYAEAINETGQTALAYPKLAELRKRAGIDSGANKLYGMKPNMTVEEMRTFIQNERRIELMNEDHRWNDIRRWKIAVTLFTANNGFNQKMRITKTGSTYTYSVVPSHFQHKFRPEMYLMPIPYDEIVKMPALVQNPGW
jgi:hypothetical protein